MNAPRALVVGIALFNLVSCGGDENCPALGDSVDETKLNGFFLHMEDQQQNPVEKYSGTIQWQDDSLRFDCSREWLSSNDNYRCFEDGVVRFYQVVRSVHVAVDDGKELTFEGTLDLKYETVDRYVGYPSADWPRCTRLSSQLSHQAVVLLPALDREVEKYNLPHR